MNNERLLLECPQIAVVASISPISAVVSKIILVYQRLDR